MPRGGRPHFFRPDLSGAAGASAQSMRAGVGGAIPAATVPYRPQAPLFRHEDRYRHRCGRRIRARKPRCGKPHSEIRHRPQPPRHRPSYPTGPTRRISLWTTTSRRTATRRGYATKHSGSRRALTDREKASARADGFVQIRRIIRPSSIGCRDIEYTGIHCKPAGSDRLKGPCTQAGDRTAARFSRHADCSPRPGTERKIGNFALDVRLALEFRCSESGF